MFAFAFEAEGDTPGAEAEGGKPAAPVEATLREAREVRLSERLVEAETWEVCRLSVGAHELRHSLPPEASLPALLGSEEGQPGIPPPPPSKERGAAEKGGSALAAASDLAAAATSDLIPGVYEGGFKLWEGTRDLLEVLHEMCAAGELALDGAAVLEAGCGAGLPGALAMRLGCRTCVLCDYNPSVLSTLTMQTIRLNGLWPRAESGALRFLSGDWASVTALLSEERSAATARQELVAATAEALASGPFDLILSAETIYSVDSSARLWQLIRDQLRPGGTALVAAKSYYFGVGGSVADFKARVESAEPSGEFGWRVLRTFEDGASNRRVCVAVTRKKAESAESGLTCDPK